MMKTLQPIDPEEIKVLVFDFDGELEESEAIAVAAVASTTASGADASPELVLVGTPQVSGRQVLQRIKGRVETATYKLRARAVGDGGLAHVITALLPCGEA
jgi:hypothetical protein